MIKCLTATQKQSDLSDDRLLFTSLICMYIYIYVYVYMYIYIYIYIYTYIYILFSSVKLLFYFHADWKIQKLQKHCISHCLFQPHNIKFLMRSGLDLLKVWPYKSSFHRWFFQHILSKQISVLTHSATRSFKH